jgi:prepilin-type N-terminal cleavage/methylation domain-containing protein
MSRLTNRRGVTLIELVVVIMLMAIVAGVAAPAFTSFDRRTPTGVDAVVDLIRHARLTAVEQGRAVTLTIDPATARYWLDAPDTTDVLALPQGVTLSAMQPRVHLRFAPTGGVDADPILVHEQNAVTPIVLDRWTGELRNAR